MSRFSEGKRETIKSQSTQPYLNAPLQCISQRWKVWIVAQLDMAAKACA
jgi:hypothetical protein